MLVVIRVVLTVFGLKLETQLFEVMNILILSFLFAMAMGDSVGIRMAKSLGEGHATRAAFVARLGIIVSLIGGLVIAGQDDIRLPCHGNVQYVDSVLRSTEPRKRTWCQKITCQYLSWERPVFAGVVFAVIPVVVPLMSKDSKPWKLLDSNHSKPPCFGICFFHSPENIRTLLSSRRGSCSSRSDDAITLEWHCDNCIDWWSSTRGHCHLELWIGKHLKVYLKWVLEGCKGLDVKISP